MIVAPKVTNRMLTDAARKGPGHRSRAANSRCLREGRGSAANVRASQPRQCGKPIVTGMHCCEDHKTTLIPYGESGAYTRGGSYVVVTVYRGKQTKTFHPTLALAGEAKGDRTGTTRKVPAARTPFDVYARDWIKNCQSRTRRGFDEDT